MKDTPFPLPQGIYRDRDGTYCWSYEVNLWKWNPIAESLARVMLLVILVVLAPLLLLMHLDDGIVAALTVLVTVIPGALLGAALLCFVGYVLYAAIYGGRYCAVFSMDDTKIVHSRSRRHAGRDDLLAAASLLAGDPSTGVMLLSTQSFTSAYRDVRKISFCPRKNLIRLDGILIKNRIYADAQQYPFVAEYLRRHCSDARQKGT